MRKPTVRWLLAGAVSALCLSLVPAPPARSITLYDIYGTVTDTSGEPFPGVTVDNGGQFAVTDDEGEYRLGQLLPGTFVIYASRPGCHTEEEHVDVLIPEDTRVDFTVTCYE